MEIAFAKVKIMNPAHRKIYTIAANYEKIILKEISWKQDDEIRQTRSQ
jgi:hypothetical protein